ncbi:transcriptional regulator, partial [Campylobacter jejuni]|nr:transcriptional regulator [Campylobacter jejuni]
MPIQKENGKYFLESFTLGKLSFKDIQNFAILSGIQELYPK